MRLQKQINHHDPENGLWGDCYRTCFAVILGKDAKDIPNFADETDNPNPRDPVKHARRWLGSQGYGLWVQHFEGNTSLADVLFTIEHYSPDVPVLLTGKGPRDVNHCVVAMNGKIVCDPYLGQPNDEALTGPAVSYDGGEYWWTEVITYQPEAAP